VEEAEEVAAATARAAVFIVIFMFILVWLDELLFIKLDDAFVDWDRVLFPFELLLPFVLFDKINKFPVELFPLLLLL